MLKKVNNKLLLIIIIALGVRLVGINHSFPFIFHPDEPALVRTALGIRFDLNPHHFDWPHLFVYLNYLAFMLFAKVRDIITTFGYKEHVFYLWPLMWNDNLIFYLIARIFSAALGALTIIPIFLTAKKIFNESTGLLAAAAFAIVPYHVWHSHYALVDVPMVFFLSWVLYFSSQILFRKDLKNYLLAGLFVGLAASTKYNGALSAIFVVLAHILRALTEKDERLLDRTALENLLFSGVAALMGFILGTPFAVLDLKTFIRTDGPQGALWQFTNVGDVSFVTQVQNFFISLGGKLQSNFGYTFLTIFLLGFLYVLYDFIKNRKLSVHKDLLFFFLSGLFLIFYVSGLEKLRAHYFFIAYPAVIIGGVGFLSTFLKGKNIFVSKVIWLLVFIIPLYFTSLDIYAYYQDDTRLVLNKWLQRNYKTNFVYYNGDDLLPVMEILGKRVDLVSEDRIDLAPNSILILSSHERTDLKLIESIGNKNKRGPLINIYYKQ